jgi:hypothetical protein
MQIRQKLRFFWAEIQKKSNFDPKYRILPNLHMKFKLGPKIQYFLGFRPKFYGQIVPPKPPPPKYTFAVSSHRPTDQEGSLVTDWSTDDVTFVLSLSSILALSDARPLMIIYEMRSRSFVWGRLCCLQAGNRALNLSGIRGENGYLKSVIVLCTVINIFSTLTFSKNENLGVWEKGLVTSRIPHILLNRL